MVEQIFAELARIEVLLVADGDRLQFHPREKMTPELIERLKSHKAEILANRADPWPQDYVEPDPCPNCGGLELWQTATGNSAGDTAFPIHKRQILLFENPYKTIN